MPWGPIMKYFILLFLITTNLSAMEPQEFTISMGAESLQLRGEGFGRFIPFPMNEEVVAELDRIYQPFETQDFSEYIAVVRGLTCTGKVNKVKLSNAVLGSGNGTVTIHQVYSLKCI